MSGLRVELARMTGRSETMDFRLDKDGESIMNKFCSLLDSKKLDRFLEQDCVKTLFSHLNETIELDRLQFHRVSVDYSGIQLWKVIKCLCKLANQSESVYKCTSDEEWLRTVVESRRRRFCFRSNVVPRQAYLMRLRNLRTNCPGHGCSEGFFRTSDLREGDQPTRSCTTCALADALVAEQLMRGGAPHRGVAVGRELLCLEKRDITPEGDQPRIGGGSDGEVLRVLWRKGMFARKRFPRYAILNGENRSVTREKVFFDQEREVARMVSHPNIVHCFGYSKDIKYSAHNRYLRRHFAESNWYCELSLFMELLEEDLEGRLLELARMEDPFSFRDSLHVLLQIAEAMKHLHEMKFVHGDLKPSNILLSRLAMPHSDVNGMFYLVKVADFSRAQRVDSSGAIVGTFNHAIGTHLYIAPEVLSCRRSHGRTPPEHPQKIDVYSFGIVAYQVLTGVAISSLNKDISDFGFREGTLQRVALDPDRLSLLPLITVCSNLSPQDRPTFPEICDKIQSLHSQYFPSN